MVPVEFEGRMQRACNSGVCDCVGSPEGEITSENCVASLVLIREFSLQGLISAIQETLPNVSEAFCTQHIKANVEKEFGKAAARIFAQSVRQGTKEAWEAKLRELDSVDNGRQAKAYIKKIPHQLWASHSFPDRRWGHTTSNIVEIINGVLTEARQLPPLKLLHYIWEYQQRLFSERKRDAGKLEGLLGQASTMYLHRMISAARTWDVIPARNDLNHREGTIRSQNQWINGRQEQHVVALYEETSSHHIVCSCGRPDDEYRPCEHAVALLQHHGLSPREWFGPYYSRQTIVKAYLFSYPPVLLTNLEPDETIKEPAQRIIKGRLKKKRRVPGSRPSDSDISGARTCRYCGVYTINNHNSLTCPLRLRDEIPGHAAAEEEDAISQEGDEAEGGAVDPVEEYWEDQGQRELWTPATMSNSDEEHSGDDDGLGSQVDGSESHLSHSSSGESVIVQQPPPRQSQSSTLPISNAILLRDIQAREVARLKRTQLSLRGVRSRQEAVRDALAGSAELLASRPLRPRPRRRGHQPYIASSRGENASRTGGPAVIMPSQPEGARRRRGDPAQEVLDAEAEKGNVWHRGTGIWRGYFGPPVAANERL